MGTCTFYLYLAHYIEIELEIEGQVDDFLLPVGFW
jgi:hypothetical protein